MIIIIIIIVVVPIITIVIILIIIIIISFSKLYSIPMRQKLCRSFHPWCPGVKSRCLFWICWAFQKPVSVDRLLFVTLPLKQKHVLGYLRTIRAWINSTDHELDKINANVTVGVAVSSLKSSRSPGIKWNAIAWMADAYIHYGKMVFTKLWSEGITCFTF